MIEVRIHGRGGQGNVVAAYLLATAAFTEGWHAQALSLIHISEPTRLQ